MKKEVDFNHSTTLANIKLNIVCQNSSPALAFDYSTNLFLILSKFFLKTPQASK